MNKLVIIFGIVSLMFSVTGCKSHSQKTTKTAHNICAVAQPVIVVSEDKNQK